MEKTMNQNIGHYFNHLTCTIFLALGLMGLFATASQAARDTTAPIVSITSPTSGTIVTSAKTVRIAASASDKVGIRKVDFYDGTTLLKNDTTSPYYFDWPVTSAKNGSHTLTAKAYDAAGNSKVSSAVTVTVNIPVQDLSAPTVSLSSPGNATTYLSAQTVTIAANASDNVGVSKVEFYNGATLLKDDTTSPYDVAWAISAANNGSHTLTAKAYDAAGNNKVSSSVTVTVNIPVQDLTAPTVALTSPANATTYTSAQTVTITANASDNVGVSRVEFYNGATLLKNDTALPYDVPWTISTANNGSHTLTAKAYDAAGNSKVSTAVTATVNIPVQNLSAPTVSLTSPTAGTTFTTAQTVRIAATTSITGVSKVDFYNGTTLLKNDTTSPYFVDWAITSANNGNHNLTAKVYDAAGNSKVATVAVTVNIPVQDLSLPTVTITSPTAGTTITSAQTVRIAASATSTTGISKVDLYDGATLLKNDTTSPYYFDWAITSANNGNHNLTAKVYDAAGNSTVSSVAVSVNIATSAITDPVVSGPLKVFPGALGFGTETLAGRGGKIIKVTNLNDSGTGSLRAAVDATGARIVVFEVSGMINLASKLNIYNPYLTIAGQTAPSPGITLKGCGFNIRSHDILIQHLRIRVGDDLNGPDPNERDALQIIQTGAYNVVIDHISGSWAVDENGSTWASQKNITISNSIFSEGLYNSIHPEGSHSMGFIIGNNSKNIAFIGNLLAHNKERQPRVSGGVTAVIANNVMYNIGGSTQMDIGQSASYSTPVPDIASQLSIAGNVFIPGPNTSSTHRGMYVLAPEFNETTKIYLQDNKIINGTLFTYATKTDPRVSTPPLWVPNLTVRPSAETEAWVLANVGARPADRDAVDVRITYEVATRTGHIIDSPGQVGGWPTLRNNPRTFPLPANPNSDDDGDGYTNIEEILHQMAAVVEGKTSL